MNYRLPTYQSQVHTAADGTPTSIVITPVRIAGQRTSAIRIRTEVSR